MDGTILQMVGLIVLGWLVLAVLVSAGLAVFLCGGQRLDRELPVEPAALGEWVTAGQHLQARHGTRVA